eukprot:1160966-Pelagomonas_calceolata.AAC.5
MLMSTFLSVKPIATPMLVPVKGMAFLCQEDAEATDDAHDPAKGDACPLSSLSPAKCSALHPC